MTRPLPDLPVPVTGGMGARAGGALFVGLGSAGNAVFRLDLTDPQSGWRGVAPFPGPAPSQPTTAVSNGSIYVFSGAGRDGPTALAPTVLDAVYRYDPAAGRWERVVTVTPTGLLGASATTRPDGAIVIFGGYNKAVFDRFMAEISAIDRVAEPERWLATQRAFMARPAEAFRWNGRVLAYQPRDNGWSDLGASPYAPNTGAALIELGGGRIALVSGEMKPGLRDSQVKVVDLSGGKLDWLAPMPSPEGRNGQPWEGVAGAFSGRIGNTPVFAGGTAFPGARTAFSAGQMFAHEGLTKVWQRDVFAFRDAAWHRVGQLPDGLAYGASFSLPEGLLLVGGEDENGTARAETRLMTLDRAGKLCIG
ncbi:MAG: YjhT family mutarotase [Rhodobacteraceae bacterium]|nr:YjhT family mutarotase [Paracoccaceae bacterium]